MDPKDAPTLTHEQAWQIQQELLEAFSSPDFQEKLHAQWFGARTRVERVQRRTELCLPIQCRVISRFGFEPSRKGVFLTSRALEHPALLGDAQLLARNATLAQLVEPDMQSKPGLRGPPGPPSNAPKGSRIELDLRHILARFTIQDKIGQMLQLERAVAWQEELCQIITKHGVGSILSGGGSAPDPNTPLEWANMVDAFQKAALAANTKLPLIYGNDSVHGQANVTGAVLFPHNIGLGCTGDPEIVQHCAEITAIESRATGVHWVFAPALSVVQDIRWGRSYEAFSDDFDIVTKLGVAAVQGYQAHHTIACIKHWIGDGATNFHSGKHPFDQGDCTLTEPELRKTHMRPYMACLQAGAQTVMASFSSVRGQKCHGHQRLLTKVLKHELGFDGLVVSDWAAVDQLAPRDQFKQALALAVNAGIDMIMLPGVVSSGHHSYDECIWYMQEALEEGLIHPSRLDDAVARILRVKARAGLLQSPWARREDLPLVGCKEHRAVAREAVRRSLVLLKNNDVLPLRPGSKVLLTGSCADDLGRQCGGWSIWHQGFCGNEGTEGTTIREGLDEAGVHILFDPLAFDTSFLSRCDTVVAVCGEKPYAEMDGDRNDYSQMFDQTEYELIYRVKGFNEDLKVVLVLVCGRPLPLQDDMLDMVDAILVAWLPGTEGAGVADVLIGAYPPTGSLSVRWPSVSEGWGSSLFDRGHGLTYTAGCR